MLVNILSTEIKEWAIVLTVETVGFLARMGYKVLPDDFVKHSPNLKIRGFCCLISC